MRTFKVKSETDGRCNTCCRPVASPFRYKTADGKERGCVASCHDAFVAANARPAWREARMVLPTWISEARRAMPMFERLELSEEPRI